MRGNCSTEDEPGYRRLLHGSSSPRRSLRLFASRPPVGFGKQGLDGDRASRTAPHDAEAIWNK